MERIAMSQEERDWLDWLKRARDGQVTQKWAAEKMGVSDRWVRRLLAAAGFPVEALVRTDIGAVSLGEQRPGSIRPLRADEIGQLYKLVGL